MRNASINKYLSKKPCVICSADTHIEVMNEAAALTGKFYPGELLSEYMAPLDVLKFEASVRSVFSLPPLIMPVNKLYAEGYAAVYFEEILGRFFAVAAFYKNLQECEKDTYDDDSSSASLSPFIGRLIEDLVNIPDKSYAYREDIGMFRAADITERAVRDISENSRFFDCDVTFENAPDPGGEAVFTGIGLHSFLKAIALIMYAVNDLSADRKVTVSVTFAGKVPQVTFKTVTKRTKAPARTVDSLSEAVPSAGAALTLCDYIAGCSGFKLSVLCRASGEVSLSLYKNYTEPPEAELKCPDMLEGYDDGIKSAVDVFEYCTKSGAKQ